MRLPTGLVKHRRASLRRALVIAVVLFAGGGEGAALALLAPDPDRSGSRPRDAAFASVTAAPTRFAASPGTDRRRGARAYYRRTAARHVPASAEAGFAALYREAARTYGVSWRLIASIHRQETAFSTEPSTYHGLNAFGCCAGPMQFNVRNGPPSTWKLYRQSFRQGRRPRRYPHRTRSHPSVYDDFDAIMAAGALLRDGGAGAALDGGAWSAAYAYYGHDLFGIDYANEVVARAQGWELYGFCVNCPVDAALVGVLDDVYGSDAREQLLAGERSEEAEKLRKRRAAQARKRAAERKRRREALGDAADRLDGGPPAALPKTEPTPSPEPEPQPPAPPAVTEPAPQPAAPPPAKTCTKLERLLGCGRPGA
jgi:hypothetical protein